MTGDNRKPWDVRLVEWMQRGSSTARSTTWTPLSRAVYTAVLVVLAILYGGAVYYVLAGALVVTSLVLGVREYKQRARGD